MNRGAPVGRTREEATRFVRPRRLISNLDIVRRSPPAASRLRPILLLAVCLLPFAFPLPARAVSNAGSTGAEFLTFGTGAKSGAMGDAGAAWADDAFGISYNPSGIARNSRDEVGFFHNTLFSDLQYNYIGAVQPIGSNAALGYNALYVDLGNVDRTTINSGLANQVLGKSNGLDVAGSVTYARALSRFLDVGGTVKVVYEKLDRFSATAGAVDLGLKWYQPLEGLTVGLSVANLGSRLQFVREREELPITLRLGIGYRSPSGRYGLTSDLAWVKNQDLEAKVGGEFWVLPKQFALRAGFNSANDVGSGFTAGAAFRWNDIALDYAYIPFGDIGDENLVSLSYQFGPSRPPLDWGERPAKAGRQPVSGPARKGLYAAALKYRAGPEELDWFGKASMEIFRHDWRKTRLNTLVSQNALYRVEGDYWVEGKTVVLAVRLLSGTEIIRNFDFSGEVDKPFGVWDEMLVEVNRELERLGVDVATTEMPVRNPGGMASSL